MVSVIGAQDGMLDMIEALSGDVDAGLAGEQPPADDVDPSAAGAAASAPCAARCRPQSQPSRAVGACVDAQQQALEAQPPPSDVQAVHSRLADFERRFSVCRVAGDRGRHS